MIFELFLRFITIKINEANLPIFVGFISKKLLKYVASDWFLLQKNELNLHIIFQITFYVQIYYLFWPLDYLF